MKTVLIIVLGWGFVFLLGAFYSVSFDISTWSASVRSACVIFFAGMVPVGLLLGNTDKL